MQDKTVIHGQWSMISIPEDSIISKFNYYICIFSLAVYCNQELQRHTQVSNTKERKHASKTVTSRWCGTYWLSDCCGLKLAALGLVDVTAELRGVGVRDSVGIWQRKFSIIHCLLVHMTLRNLHLLGYIKQNKKWWMIGKSHKSNTYKTWTFITNSKTDLKINFTCPLKECS